MLFITHPLPKACLWPERGLFYMKNTYHILNGDALRQQLPEDLEGEIIVFQECLVDGPVKADSPEELFKLRAPFIAEFYGDYTEKDYLRDSASELKKILAIEDGSTVNLWFEDDLFCQVNFWCATDLLSEKNVDLYLVRPETHTQYGFGAYQPEELTGLADQRMLISEQNKIAALWKAYQIEDTITLTRIGEDLQDSFPFIYDAVQAHLQRIPGNGSEGRPIESLRKIMKELGNEPFGSVFREFSKREVIYGFGDLQVKRMVDEILKNN